SAGNSSARFPVRAFAELRWRCSTMKVPCPVPLQSPWSPAGYQVVEVADEKTPAVPGHAPTTSPARAGKKPEPKWLPSSPLGYRITQVADEEVPAPVRSRWSHVPVARVVGPRRTPPLVVWGSLMGGGVFVVAFLFVMLMVAVSNRDRAAQPRAVRAPRLVQ